MAYQAIIDTRKDAEKECETLRKALALRAAKRQAKKDQPDLEM